MNCEFCSNEFNNQNRKPHTLPCNHNICLKCIYKQKKQNEKLCPICKTEFPINLEVNDQLLPLQNQISDSEIQRESIRLKALEIINSQLSELTSSFDYKFEIVAIGSASTGKTCLFNRYFKNIFQQADITLNFNMFSKSFKINNETALLTAMDTSGEEKFRSLTQNYVKNKQCILFVFSLADQRSFEDLNGWIKWAEDICEPDCLKILVGTQKDRNRQVNNIEAKQLAKKMEMAYFETSSKENVNIDILFQYVLYQLYSKFRQEINRKKCQSFKMIRDHDINEKKYQGKSCCQLLIKILIFLLKQFFNIYEQSSLKYFCKITKWKISDTKIS